MWPGQHAQTQPDKTALIMAGSGESLTYAELDERSNRLAQLFAASGLGFGDHVAIFMENNLRYLEVLWAAQRSGLYYTAINSHATVEEAAFLLKDCEAQLLITSLDRAPVAGALPELAPQVARWLMVDGTVPGFESYEEAVAVHPATPIEEQLEGHAMLYSSGTTGQPKGIRYQLERQPIGAAPFALEMFTALYGFGATDVFLSPAPLYHSAPLQFTMMLTRLGATVVVMEAFDAEAALAAIERYRVTHSQWVPTMFVRMLKLPQQVRERYDLSSLTCAIHVAAPCPVPVKEQMIGWWGPILLEYYAATEGIGLTLIRSDEWLERRGSVGKSLLGPVHILDENGVEVPVGQDGRVYFEPSALIRFDYHNDPAKTAAAHTDQGWATVGDIGHVDEDGYLYLTDRSDYMIISGGVNIYPQEAENVLITHPSVQDCAVFGVPDEEMGESVKAVVEPVAWADAGPELERTLLEYCRERLAHYKCPRSVDFELQLPRQDTGKLYKRLLRDKYWAGRSSMIV